MSEDRLESCEDEYAKELNVMEVVKHWVSAVEKLIFLRKKSKRL